MDFNGAFLFFRYTTVTVVFGFIRSIICRVDALILGSGQLSKSSSTDMAFFLISSLQVRQKIRSPVFSMGAFLQRWQVSGSVVSIILEAGC